MPWSFEVGSEVTVISGKLAGLKGRVVRLTENNNCVLSIDGLAEGTHVVVSSTMLELIE